jgi:hypothetical protein
MGDAMIGIRVDSVVRCESNFTVNQSMVLRHLGVLSDRLSPSLIHPLKLN